MQEDYFDLSDPDENNHRSKGIISISMSLNGSKLARNEFKKRMQKSGWKWIFNKMNLEKHSTKGLREDINKFVEKQQDIPFTMRNIYHMLDMVIQTTGQRMDKAILEVFDKVTRHSHDNHHKVEGWKTNSHYLLTKRFIVPGYYKEEMEDMVKALCYITAGNYDDHLSLDQRTRYAYALTKDGKLVNDRECEDYTVKYLWHDHQVKNGEGDRAIEKHPGSKLFDLQWEYGKWFDWGFFQVRHYKKGTYHFEFKSEDVWALFNSRVAKIKGYPLPERKEQTKYQERQNNHKPVEPMATKKGREFKTAPVKPVVLATIKI